MPVGSGAAGICRANTLTWSRLWRCRGVRQLTDKTNRIQRICTSIYDLLKNTGGWGCSNSSTQLFQIYYQALRLFSLSLSLSVLPGGNMVYSWQRFQRQGNASVRTPISSNSMRYCFADLLSCFYPCPSVAQFFSCAHWPRWELMASILPNQVQAIIFNTIQHRRDLNSGIAQAQAFGFT